MFTTQFSFFFLTAGVDNCVEQVSVEEPNDLSVSLGPLSAVSRLAVMFSNTSSGIDSLTLRFCQNIQQFVILLGIQVLTKLAVIINYFIISSVTEILGTIISRNPALLMYLVDILLQIVVGKSSRIFQLLI